MRQADILLLLVNLRVLDAINVFCFGVNATSDMFQSISYLLADKLVTRNLLDDIIVHGRSQADRALWRTLNRLQGGGAKLNKDKCVFFINKIPFLVMFSVTLVYMLIKRSKLLFGVLQPRSYLI